MLKQVRGWSEASTISQDWTAGRSSEIAARKLQNTPRESGEHAFHHMEGAQTNALPTSYAALDRLVPTVQAAALPPPVLISPPTKASARWTARSDTANRPRRATLELDDANGKILLRRSFADKPLIDRIVGIGVAAHEGQLFAPLNQVLGLLTAVGLQILSVSAIVLWWRRRPAKSLGAPPLPAARRYAPFPLVLVIVLLAVLLPLLGLSLVLGLCLERWVLRRFDGVSQFLGLSRAPRT
jgi:uncharacterized iron-regulated membrane protein